MKTSELFAEILVIGVGATAWVLLLLLTLCPDLLSSISGLNYLTLLPGMAIVYVAGIMTDRFADLIFRRFVPSKYKKMSPEEKIAFKSSRDRIVEKNEYVQILYHSSQSRKKIMRGWAVNFIGLAFATVFGLLMGSETLVSLNMSYLVVLTFVLLALLCWFFWRDMDMSQKKVFERLMMDEGSDKQGS